MIIIMTIKLLHGCIFSPTAQANLMGSSAQIGSGVCLCGWQLHVPEGSRRVRKGSGGFGLERCPEGSGGGGNRCRCHAQVEGSVSRWPGLLLAPALVPYC